MKMKRILFLIALFAAGSATAQEQMKQDLTARHHTVSTPAATTSVGELKFHWLSPAPPADLQNNREPIEGLSPQAWTTIAGWNPGVSAFPNDDNSNTTTGMPVLWFGHEPWE